RVEADDEGTTRDDEPSDGETAGEAGVEPSGAAPESEETRLAAETPEQGDGPDASAEEETEGEAPDAEPGGSPAETAPAPSGPRPSFRVERGRIAYMRCEGLAPRNGRCPRDAALERQAWSVVTETMATCPALGDAEGGADVRLRLGAGATEVRFREWGDPPLPLSPLWRCLRSAVSGIRSTLDSTDLVLSLRVQRMRDIR
ncbi:MAG: hypothetical protein AAGH15_03865, partial [Myxococcota bacterium]